MEQLLRVLQDKARRKLRRLHKRGQDGYACEHLSQGMYLTDKIVAELRRQDADFNGIRGSAMEVLTHYLLGGLFEDGDVENPRGRGPPQRNP